MSGFVPRRVSSTRTAMGSTDAESTGMNGHSIVSTLGRRSTLLNRINKKAFGSIYQINYFNALTTGDACTMEDLAPVKSFAPLQLASDVFIPLRLFRDNFTTGFVTRTMQNALVDLYNGNGVMTDEFCSFGNILNNVGDAIFLPNDITQAQGNSPSPCRGWRLVAIERWYSGGVKTPPNGNNYSVAQLSQMGGWTALHTNSTPTAQDYHVAQGIVIVLEPTNNQNLSTVQQPPIIRINGGTGTNNNLLPTAVAQVTDFGGVPFNGYVIGYGGTSAGPGGQPAPGGWPVPGNSFIAGLNPGMSKDFSVMFVS